MIITLTVFPMKYIHVSTNNMGGVYMNLGELYKLVSVSRKTLRDVLCDYEQLAVAGVDEDDIYQQLLDYYSEEGKNESKR